MATQIVRVIEQSIYDTPIAGITSSFDTDKKIQLDLTYYINNQFSGKLQGLWVFLSSISTASTITMRLCTDAQGDEIIVTDTVSTISTGITTGTKGSAIWSISLDVFLSTNKLYLFIKTDASTVTCDRVWMTMEAS